MNVSERWTYLNNRGNHYYYRKDYQEALKYMRRANVLVSSYPQMVFEQNFIKVNLGELYLLTDKLDSAQSCLCLLYTSAVGVLDALTERVVTVSIIWFVCFIQLAKGFVGVSGDD